MLCSVLQWRLMAFDRRLIKDYLLTYCCCS